MYIKILVSFFLCSALTIQAQEESQKLENPGNNMVKQGVLPSARKCIGSICENRCSGFISKIDFIYFQPKEDGFEYVAKNDGPDLSKGSSILNLNAKTSNFDFPYKPGFKLGMGFYVPRLSWDVFFNWMPLYSKCSSHDYLSQDNAGRGLIPLFWNPSAFENTECYIRFSESKSKLNFSINSLDFEMGDSFFTSPRISLRLHGGLKGAIIHQRFYVSYNEGNNILVNGSDIHLLTGSTKIRSDFKGLGPRIGLDSSWNLYCSNFSIIADGSFAFLLSRFDIRHHEHDTAFNNATANFMAQDFKIHEYVWLVRPVAQLKLGLNWGKCFGACNKYYFGMNAAYEMEYFWEQNLSRRLIDEQVFGITYPNKGDLYLHGLVLSTHFEF